MSCGYWRLTGYALWLVYAYWSLTGYILWNTSSVSPACRKGRLNGAVCRNHRINRVVPCLCWTGTLKNPARCLSNVSTLTTDVTNTSLDLIKIISQRDTKMIKEFQNLSNCQC